MKHTVVLAPGDTIALHWQRDAFRPTITETLGPPVEARRFRGQRALLFELLDRLNDQDFAWVARALLNDWPHRDAVSDAATIAAVRQEACAYLGLDRVVERNQ